jgi:hypothetical protein
MKALLILTLIYLTSAAAAFDYVGKDPAPAEPQKFSLLVAPPTAPGPIPFDQIFLGPDLGKLREAEGSGRKFNGNGFIAADEKGQAWQITCEHVTDHWSKTKLGGDIVGFSLSGAPKDLPKIGTYREGYNVTIASWVLTGDSLEWHVTDARTRKIPKYRAKDEADDFARIYGELGIPAPDMSLVRIAEVSKIGKTPIFGPGCSGSPVWQKGAIVGVLIVAPDGHSMVSDGVFFSLFKEPRR